MRKYYRLSSRSGTAIGAWNPVKEENTAFISFSRHFASYGLPVPQIFQADPDNNVYLVEDLGDTSLLSQVEFAQNKGTFPEEVRRYYQQALTLLIRFQVEAARDLDYSLCYPREQFDSRSMGWDLNYFKYYFLRLHTGFHEERLEDDFTQLVAYLDQADSQHFMYRDFQARNILIRNDELFFIDYQGGRKGPLQYDVASLLFQSKAALPPSFRDEMLDYYLKELNKVLQVNEDEFRSFYDGFVLIRILQVLGAYGFRGLIEKKPYFMLSIPGALKNLEWWLQSTRLPLELPELRKCLLNLVQTDKYKRENQITSGKLTVAISSFSYKNSIPVDLSGYGGGFVFDCRALPNPGREEQYRDFNGRDKVIIDYLEKYSEVSQFLRNSEQLVIQAVENYLERKFERLTVQFGCTGGQHRSVYCAEKLAAILRERYPQVIIQLTHPMLNSK